MNQIEIIGKRKPREKHFLNEDGTITVNVYDHDVHFEKNRHYENIDTTLEEENDKLVNKNNTFISSFDKNNAGFINVEKDGFYLKLIPKDYNSLIMSNNNGIISYKDINKEIEFTYKIEASKLKEAIILNCKETIPDKITYLVNTNLKLEKDGKRVLAKNLDKVIFTIEAPFMIDSAGNINNDTDYELKQNNSLYEIDLVYNLKFLKDKNTPFPVTIDPTIINGDGENVYDVFISKKNNTINRNNAEFLLVGSDEDDTNRMLLKFILPEISPKYNIIDAQVHMTAYKYSVYLPGMNPRITNVHAINSDWDETTATWDNMSNNYDELIETYFTPKCNNSPELSLAESAVTDFSITNLVKKWYSGKLNYGIMLKWANEEYSSNSPIYWAYSKTYDALNEAAGRAYLTITYVLQSGLEDNYDYTNMQYCSGDCKVNNFNGNVINCLSLGNTGNNSKAISLLMYHNSDHTINQDLISSFVKDWKLSYYEYLKEVTIDSQNCLEYLDVDGTINYFYKNGDYYQDELGMQLKVELIDAKYIMSDIIGNKKIFTLDGDKYLLTEITSTENDKVTIHYSQGKIVKIEDPYASAINISYSDNLIEVKTDQDTAKLYLTNNTITSIEYKNRTMMIEYTSEGLISHITDFDGMGYLFEYYDKSYKLKKITHIGLNNEEGQSIELIYDGNVTNIIRNNQKDVLTFNNLGKLISFVSYDDKTLCKLKDAYGYTREYNDASNINLQTLNSDTKAIKYVNNLLDSEPYSVLEGTASTDCANFGKYGYKSNSNTLSIKYRLAPVPESDSYTLSFYIKNDTETNVSIYYEVDVSNINLIDMVKIPISNEYVRYEVNVPKYNAQTVLRIDALGKRGGTLSIADCQLEEGKIANSFNLVSNSDFSNGINGWNVRGGISEFDGTYKELTTEECCSIVTLDSGEKALKLNSYPNGSCSASRIFDYSGKKGDVFTLAFWYKNEGVLDNEYGMVGNIANIQFVNVDENIGTGTMNLHMYNHSSEWQFFYGSFVADFDYSRFLLNIISQNEANNIYITDVMLIKNLGSYKFEYDENGNIVKEVDYLANSKEYTYDDSEQLTSLTNENGNIVAYEYDNIITNRSIAGYTSSGLRNSYTYNADGNRQKTTLKYVGNKIIENNKCYIRCKGTESYIGVDFSNKDLIVETNKCNYKMFTFNKINNYYEILLDNNKVLVADNNVKIVKEQSGSLFAPKKNANGSYTFVLVNITHDSNQTFYNESNKALCIENNQITMSDVNRDDYKQQFYIEDAQNELFVESKREFTPSGKYVNKMIDLTGITSFDINEETGDIKSETTNNELPVYYTYNENNQVKTMSQGNISLEYNYNAHNLLESLVNKKEKYSFNYDNFFKNASILINEQPLVEYLYYPNNKRLKKTIFGNGDEINYTYDSLNRKKSFTTAESTYTHFYDNFGNLSLVQSERENYKFSYDFNSRLKRIIYNHGTLIIDCDYDQSSNVIAKHYLFNGKKHNITCTTNEENIPEVINIDDTIINKEYDKLGRPLRILLNGVPIKEYNYISKGNNTSYTPQQITANGKNYEIIYNDNYKIDKIKINDKLSYEYKYDDYGELIEEINYLNSIKMIYTYDDNGNMLVRKVLNLDNSLVKKDIFNYENINWLDQLTKFNEISLKYDEIGNPVQIGDAKLSWINGQQLKSYQDSNNIITFSYNKDGFISNKTVNSVSIDYYYEGDKLIFERKNGNVIYYLRDDTNSLIGFSYNDVIYYYEKNMNDDIIGILDSNLTRVATYNYDSWGNIISVLDELGNEITDENSIALINPFRYRSYYYDKDLNLYYISTRFYSSEFKRFINIDTVISDGVLGSNLYIYCCNDPINSIDQLGEGAVARFFAGFTVGAVIQIFDNISEGEKFYKGFLGAGVSTGIDFCTYGLSSVAQKTLGVLNAPVESLTNEIIAYIPYASIINGESSYKKLTKDNLKASATTVFKDTVNNLAVGVISSKFQDSLVPVNNGWFRPEHYMSTLTSKYGKKMAKRKIIDSVVGNVFDIHMQNSIEIIKQRDEMHIMPAARRSFDNYMF